MKYFTLLLISLLLGLFAKAETQDFDAKVDQNRESEIAQKAKRRQYPGGRDEADLKVQTQLVQPVRKMTPNLEEEPSEPASDD